MGTNNMQQHLPVEVKRSSQLIGKNTAVVGSVFVVDTDYTTLMSSDQTRMNKHRHDEDGTRRNHLFATVVFDRTCVPRRREALGTKMWTKFDDRNR